MSIRKEVCGQREVQQGKGRVNCSHSWFLPEETETVAITSCRLLPSPEKQDLTQGDWRTPTPTNSLSTSLTWQTDLCASLSKFSGPVREGEIEGKNMRAGEKKIKREGGREVTVMKEELLFRSTLLSSTFSCEDPLCHFSLTDDKK